MPAAGRGHVSPPDQRDVKAAQNSVTNDEVLDVKPNIVPPSEDVVTRKGVAAEADVDIDEADLAALETESKIPYNRFKEVNDKMKSLQKELETERQRQADAIRREVELAELRLKSRLEQDKTSSEDEDLEPWERQIKALNSQISELTGKINTYETYNSQNRLESQIKALKEEFPDADDLAVLGWKKANPQADLRDLMAHSHERINKSVQAKIQKIIEQKKQKSRIPTTEGGGIRLKPEERPKTISDAGRLARRYLE